MTSITIYSELYSFNSIKVRLKHGTSAGTVSSVLRFQFHKGPIKAKYSPCADFLEICFNSIKVRLKHDLREAIREAVKGFNSIKVRLKRSDQYQSMTPSSVSIP